jgi:hypothetical protein
MGMMAEKLLSLNIKIPEYVNMKFKKIAPALLATADFIGLGAIITVLMAGKSYNLSPV